MSGVRGRRSEVGNQKSEGNGRGAESRKKPFAAPGPMTKMPIYIITHSGILREAGDESRLRFRRKLFDNRKARVDYKRCVPAAAKNVCTCSNRQASA